MIMPKNPAEPNMPSSSAIREACMRPEIMAIEDPKIPAIDEARQIRKT